VSEFVMVRPLRVDTLRGKVGRTGLQRYSWKDWIERTGLHKEMYCMF